MINAFTERGVNNVLNKNNIIFLGGNVKENINWLKLMRDNFDDDYNVYDMHYNHWQTGSEINFDKEIKKLTKLISDAKLVKYSIVAKSVGSILTLKAIFQEKINPSSFIMLGLPLKYLERNLIDIKDELKYASLKSKTMLIQESKDPIGSYDEVVGRIPQNIKVFKINGNTHEYNNVNEIKPLVKMFVAKEEKGDNMARKYNKLVRDKIPEKIKKNNEIPIVEILDDAQYLKQLKLKLAEELDEYLRSGEIDELADLQEAMYAILKHENIDIADFEKIRTDKVSKNGAFEKRFFLKDDVKEG